MRLRSHPRTRAAAAPGEARPIETIAPARYRKWASRSRPHCLPKGSMSNAGTASVSKHLHLTSLLRSPLR
ncbi:hypothetical protein AKJ09_06977 [Labilithrix luteola]|uniref:Uncharacterized protein n=1 Tax=Labilithrix luteola TaxID=1391654 RepID=A0A0K1Q3H5_9BACT|nr:hypothetical protein AKJ09_06977 [Labilithrix luteola]